LGWPTETAAPKSKTSLDQLDAEFDADADLLSKKSSSMISQNEHQAKSPNWYCPPQKSVIP
jgi:hypothetical protein